LKLFIGILNIVLFGVISTLLVVMYTSVTFDESLQDYLDRHLGENIDHYTGVQRVVRKDNEAFVVHTNCREGRTCYIYTSEDYENENDNKSEDLIFVDTASNEDKDKLHDFVFVGQGVSMNENFCNVYFLYKSKSLGISFNREICEDLEKAL
jgi:hypothetical protein